MSIIYYLLYISSIYDKMLSDIPSIMSLTRKYAYARLKKGNKLHLEKRFHMKFVHIADVHLGMQPDLGYSWSEARKRELYETFFRAIDFCKEQDVDLLLIAGDLFHRQPNRQELAEVFYALTKLNKTKVVFIAGNHDYMGPGSLYETEKWPTNVKVLQKENVETYHIEELNTYIYGYSYETQDVKENRIQNIRPLNKEGYHILLAHGGDESNNPLNRKELVDTPFDYVALGHIHKPERIGARAAYPGSLEPLDKTETGAHGFILGTLGERGCYLQFINFAKRHYEQLIIEAEPGMTLYALRDKLQELIYEQGKENIYKILLEGIVSGQLLLEKEVLYSVGNIVEVVDRTKPDYDYEKLSYENRDNIIGMYIDSIRDMDLSDEEKDLALYYGIKAFTDSKIKER